MTMMSRARELEPALVRIKMASSHDKKDGEHILFCLVELADGRISGSEYFPLRSELEASG